MGLFLVTAIFSTACHDVSLSLRRRGRGPALSLVGWWSEFSGFFHGCLVPCCPDCTFCSDFGFCVLIFSMKCSSLMFRNIRETLVPATSVSVAKSRRVFHQRVD